ncbi:hypothetical protein DQ04_05561030 [Trypanosoma grayi]|uniref:hypothetical protein n=1 Tax=Trypanosoma grayi TaxID=71804 RepID=UPI0004F43D1A|nr:hypothetical protein DQ04_05561030 [Trypanosoma grayi]KEG09239.1 hypothetical protein DQ04_05561030 [Trypanosoma grayi]
MVTIGLGSAALELLQSYSIDLKDFSKARARYENVRAELAAAATDDQKAAESTEIRQQLVNAWEEYLTLAQAYFRKVSSAVVQDLLEKSRGKAAAAHRAEKLNELCAIGEKWYVRNECYFNFEDPEKLAGIVEDALDSSSVVMRLLGLQLTRICCANVMFVRHLFSRRGCGLIGICFDRENATELEYALNMCSRLIELYASDPKAYPVFPYGWIYRIASLLDMQDPVPNLLPKRKSQALRIAVKLLHLFPEMATAASLHTLLLQYCIQKVAVAATLDEVKSILQVVLDLFDGAETRQYIRYNDLDVLYEPFLYFTEKSRDAKIATMNGAKDVLAMVMRTWVGVLWTSSERKGLCAIIDVLHLPGDLDRKMVLLTLFNKVLCQLAPHRGLTLMETWEGVEANLRRAPASATGAKDLLGAHNSFLENETPHSMADSNKGLMPFDAMLGELDDGHEDFVPTTKAIGYHVLDPFLGRVLLMLSHHGLPLALVCIIQDTSASRVLTLAASSLLQDLLVLMDTVLPVRPVKRLHKALNKAVGRLAQSGNLSLDGGHAWRLFKYCKGLKDLTVSASISNATAALSGGLSAPTSASITAYGLGSLELDDAGFEGLLQETKVEQASSYTRWNYDILLLLVNGPLRSLPRFRWVLNETRFFHKLIMFYRPLQQSGTQTFISLQAAECTPQLCVLGIALLDLFLSTREGMQALNKFDFTKSLVDILEEVVDGTTRVLDRQRLCTSVGRTLLRMVGRYSLSASGLMAMKEYKMFGIINNMFTQLTGERVTAPSNDDMLQGVCHLLLQHLYIGAVPNHGVCEEIRQIFRLALCNDSNSIRLCAAMQLRKALWRDLSTSMRWGIEILVQALHDDYYNVVESAFKLLLSICLCSDEALDYLISLSPTVLMESEVIRDHAQKLNLNTLLYCIVGRPSGFRFLQCYGWVEQELRRWEDSESANHVVLVESMQSGEHVVMSVDFREGMSSRWRQRHNRTLSDPLYALYRPALLRSSAPPTGFASSPTPGFFPSHFAAVLCKSNEGCTLFKHSNLWQRSVRRILAQQLPPEIVYDDVIDAASESSEDSDDTERTMGEENLSFYGRPAFNVDKAQSKNSAEAREIRLLQEGRLPCSYSAELLSASRGYKSAGQSYILECVGDIAELKDAILCVCHTSSSDTGYALLRTVPGLMKRLMALTRFAATVTVRSICLVGLSLLARSKRCAEQLREMAHSVLNESNAYTSADGVPYSVAFAHLKPSRWTSVGRLVNSSSASSPYFAHTQCGDGVAGGGGSGGDVTCMLGMADCGIMISSQSRRVWDQVCALSNPVSREGAKKKLYQLMRHQPQVFVEPLMRGMLLDAAQTFRMRHAERKFIAGLLENAPLTKPVSGRRRAVVVDPPSPQN